MNYLHYLEKEIHSVIAATVDDSGLPVTCAIDIMGSDEKGLFFLTAKGKGFYTRLKKNEYVALTGIKGKDTLSCVAISLQGKVKELGNMRLPLLFEKKPYMQKIYPTKESQKALTVFLIYEGSGEWFNLSKQPIERASFTIGNKHKEIQGYEITEKCNGCQTCQTVCPQDCIDFSTVPAVIKQKNCLHCGNCFTVCSQKAVVHRG